MKNLTRRELLKLLGGASAGLLLFNPYRPLFKAIVDGLIADAEAGVAGQTAKNYLLFLQYGAPSRWCWDNFIHPTNQAEDFMANGSVKNFIISANGRYTGDNADADYRNGAAVNYIKSGAPKSIHMPILWDVNLPIYRGGQAIYDPGNPVLMRDYLQHAMIIRGVHMGVDVGHVKGPELIAQPSPNVSSLTGRVAEQNGGVIPAVGITGRSKPYLGYKSQGGAPIAVSRGGGSNGPLFDLLEPFVASGARTPASDTHKANEILMEQAMNDAISELKAYALSARPGSAAIYDAFEGSKALFADAATEFNNLQGDFAAIVTKYRSLVDKSRDAVPGIIPPPDVANGLRDGFSVGFAVAEYLIKKGYTSSFTFDSGSHMSMGRFVDDNDVVQSSGNQNDEHQQGDRQLSSIAVSFTYRSFMACLNHFRESIGEGEWQNTVVQYGSEYGRRPRNDGSGTDHAPQASTYTLFSGAITDFMPIGNCYTDASRGKGSGNLGSWGVGAPTLIEGLAGPAIITKEMAANTVADILGVSHPIGNSISLVKQENGKFVSKAEDPSNV